MARAPAWGLGSRAARPGGLLRRPLLGLPLFLRLLLRLLALLLCGHALLVLLVLLLLQLHGQLQVRR